MDSPNQFDRIWSVGEIGTINGVATILNPNVNDATAVFLTRDALFSGVPGHLSYHVNPGVGVTINSTSANENALIAFMFVQRST